jgi:hypothetical protein
MQSSRKEGEIRRCLQNEAYVVQIDFTEARLSIKSDSSLRLSESFIDLNNLVMERFTRTWEKLLYPYGVIHSTGYRSDKPHLDFKSRRSSPLSVFRRFRHPQVPRNG